MTDESLQAEPPSLTTELQLEPVRFIARTDVVLRFGEMMLAAGASSARVGSTMQRAAKAVGIDELGLRVGMADIVATVHQRGLYRTRVVGIERVSIDAGRITALQRLSHRLHTRYPVAQLERDLDAIRDSPPVHRMTLRVLGAAFACAAFALLNNGGWQDAVAAGLAVGLAQWMRMLMGRARVNEFLVVVISAVIALLAYLGLAEVLYGMTGMIGDAPEALTSAVLFLVPGFALVTGALDLARLDLAAGTERIAYASLVLMATAVAIWAVVSIFPEAVTDSVDARIAEPLLSLLRLVAGFVGVFGFAVLFCTPWAIAATAAGIGAIANTARLYLVDMHSIEPAVAAAIAGLIVGIGAYLVTGRLRSPRVALTVPAVLIMVPGAATYRAIVAIIDGDTVDAIAQGMEALFVVMALAVGLTISRIFTEREWSGHVSSR